MTFVLFNYDLLIVNSVLQFSTLRLKTIAGNGVKASPRHIIRKNSSILYQESGSGIH